MIKTCMISQTFGIGDILFVQKIARHLAGAGYRVIFPILEKFSWMRYYLEPHPNIEMPLICERAGQPQGDFQFAEAFMELSGMIAADPGNPLYRSPLVYNGGDDESSFIFLPLASSYVLLNDKMMPAKYRFVGLDYADWPTYAKLKRRTHVEQELYYDVLGLKTDSRFTFVNENSSRSKVSLNVPGEVVHLKAIDGFTLFDWSLVIERAAQIVTIDTSLVLLTEILQQRKPLYMISRYDPPGFDCLKDVLTLDWNLVLTPQELRVDPA